MMTLTQSKIYLAILAVLIALALVGAGCPLFQEKVVDETVENEAAQDAIVEDKEEVGAMMEDDAGVKREATGSMGSTSAPAAPIAEDGGAVDDGGTIVEETSNGKKNGSTTLDTFEEGDPVTGFNEEISNPIQ